MRFKNLAALAVSIVGLSVLAGCFATEESAPPPGKQGIHDTTKVYLADSLLAHKVDSLTKLNDSLKLAIGKKDSVKIPITDEHGGWDDFPNKYKPTLLELAAKMKVLPMPMGTRYNAQPKTTPVNGSKISAAAAACTGISEVAAIRYNNNTIYGVDTISYYGTDNMPHCDWQTPTTRETHVRHMINDASGEAWETIDIKILDDATLPNYITHGMGRMILNNGMEFHIDSYDLDMIILYGDTTATVRTASLALSWKNGYTFKMDLAKSRPYKTVDLFPAWGDNPSLGKILSGPILHEGATAGKVDTLGYVDLYADHTVLIRDWTGAPVNAP